MTEIKRKSDDDTYIIDTVNTSTMTPYQVFTGHKPTIPTYAFETVGVFYHPRQENQTMKAEIGLFLQHGYQVKYLKGYLPTRRRTYSFQKFIPLRPQAIPQSWNYAPNVRGLRPTSQAVVYRHLNRNQLRNRPPRLLQLHSPRLS